MRGLSLVAASGGHSSSRCAGLSLLRPTLLRSTGSRCAGSVAVAHGPSCSAACGIFPVQGSNSCPLHWQADSQPLRHQGSPAVTILAQSLTHEMSEPERISTVQDDALMLHTRKLRPRDGKRLVQGLSPGDLYIETRGGRAIPPQSSCRSFIYI